MVQRMCKNCGKVFAVPAGKSPHLCEECAKKSRSNGVLRERICKMCGASFIGYPRSFFCPDCSAERKNQQRKVYDRRKPSRPLGSVDICKACGKPYIVNSARQRYCPECAKTEVIENVRAHKRDYMGEYRKGKMKTPADQKYNSGLPKSGVVGVTYYKRLDKWQATYKKKYIGLYDSVDQAAKAIAEYKNSLNE